MAGARKQPAASEHAPDGWCRCALDDKTRRVHLDTCPVAPGQVLRVAGDSLAGWLRGHDEMLAGLDPRYPHVSVVLAAAGNPVLSCGRALQVLRAAGITGPLVLAEFIRDARAGGYQDAEKVIASWVTVTGRDAGR